MSQPLPDVRLHDQTWRQIQKYRAKEMQKQGIPTINLPTGAVIDGRAFRGIRPPGADEGFVLHSPEKYLKDPKPGVRYIWRKRQDETTYGMVESHQIRPVAIDRIKRSVKGTNSIYSYAGPSDDEAGVSHFAAWKTLALFETTVDAAYEWFQHPEDWDLSRLVSNKESIEQDIRDVGARHGITVDKVEVERKDVQSAEKERVRPIGNA